MKNNDSNDNIGYNFIPAIEAFSSVLKYYDNITPKIVNTISKVADLFSRINFDEIRRWTNVISDLSYINLLKELKLPLFLIDNDNMKKEIVSLPENKEMERKAVEIALKHCDNGFVQDIMNYWGKCETIKTDRKTILKEALLLHNEKRYYASTSILMCQIYGVVSDMNKVAKKKGLELDGETKKTVAEYFNMDENKMNSEKGKIAQMITLPEQGNMAWIKIAEYLMEEVLCSSESKKRWESQPLRNKICHGDQLNFNTEEHSLKAILVIDILIQLSEQLNEIPMIEK